MRASESAYGARWTPSSVTIAAISSAGVTSKAGLRAGKRVVTSRRVALLDRDLGAGRRREIDRRGRRDDVERDPVMRGEHGERVRADLVRGVAVRGDPVGAGDDRSTSPAAISEPAAESAITACGIPTRLELPRGEARALEQRPRLVDEHALEQAALPGGAQRADRGAVAAGREAARVAVRERARAGREQLRGVRGHAPAAVDLFAVERARPLGVGSSRSCASAQTRFTAVGREAASTRSAATRSSPRSAASASPYAGGDADRGRAANDHRADRVGDLGRRRAFELDLLVRQPPLVEQDDRGDRLVEPDDAFRFECFAHGRGRTGHVPVPGTET